VREGEPILSPLELSLAGAALLIGLTGAWSPCGFSMVETIGLSGDGARRWTTIAACATFLPGAVLGGMATFGVLSALGELIHGVGGRAAYLVATAIAIAAAVAEARGVRIVPQIRRQLPERWRWTMPMPLAAALYGVLLGLGFATFVLSFGVWALAGISLALGDPGAGLVIGAAFGLGRAIPVIVVAPAVDRPLGVRCIELMAERPALYRIFRLGDAVTLGLVAVALTATGIATAARIEVRRGADPSATGKALAFQRLDRSGVLRLSGQSSDLPGRDPAIGGPYAAVISGDEIEILNRYTLNEIGSASALGAQAVAVSRDWLVYLKVRDGRYVLKARRIEHPAQPGDPKTIAAVSSPAQIGHPSVGGARVFYALSRRHRSSIKRGNLGSGKRATLLSSRRAALLNPAARGRALLYVRTRRARQGPQQTSAPPLRQSLMLKRLGQGGWGHSIHSHHGDRRLWSTSLSAKRAFVTLIGGGRPRIVSVKR
jgi:hypothetical protein